VPVTADAAVSAWDRPLPMVSRASKPRRWISTDVQRFHGRSCGVLEVLGLCERDDGSEMVALRAMGALLRSDSPVPGRTVTSTITAPWITRAWEQLPEAVSTGELVFDRVHGVGFLGPPRDESGRGRGVRCRDGRRSRSTRHGHHRVCDLTGVGTTIDVGGGHGRLLATLLATKNAVQTSTALCSRDSVFADISIRPTNGRWTVIEATRQ